MYILLQPGGGGRRALPAGHNLAVKSGAERCRRTEPGICPKDGWVAAKGQFLQGQLEPSQNLLKIPHLVLSQKLSSMFGPQVNFRE